MPHRPGLRGALLALAQLFTLSITLGLVACGGGSDHAEREPTAQAHAIYSGSTEPAASIGSIGDFFLNFTTGELFGPKTADGWPQAPITLVTMTDSGAKASLRSGFGKPAGDDGIDGDFYLDLSSSMVYGPKAEGAWPASGVALVGAAPGNSLLNGSAAPSPAIGANGDFYLQTTGSSVTLFGPKADGAWPGTGTSLVGPEGPAGQPGTGGTDGATILAGAGQPQAIDGVAGDFYFDIASATLYGPRTASGWPTSGIALAGPKGDQGDQGDPGQPGSPGHAGDPGKSVLGGTGAPDNAIGVDGDFYLDTGSTTLYGPKANAAWPAGVSLQGLQGQPGDRGADGLDGANGIDGAAILSGAGGPGNDVGRLGDFYLDTSTSTLHGPKQDANDWSSSSSVSLKGQQGDQGRPGRPGPVVFVSRFETLSTDAPFYLPVTGALGPSTSFTPTATTMPLGCSITAMYVRGAKVEGNSESRVTVTFYKNAMAAAGLALTVHLPADGTVASADTALDAGVLSLSPGDAVALRVTPPPDANVKAAISVTLLCE